MLENIICYLSSHMNSMIKIANFSSLFEVSIALHLGYSLIKNIHSAPIVIIENHIDKLKPLLMEKVESTDPGSEAMEEYDNLLTHINIIESRLKAELIPYEIKINKFILVSILVAILSIVWLIISSFSPTYSVRAIYMIGILILSILPMPLFIFLTIRYIRPKTKVILSVLTDIKQQATLSASERALKYLKDYL